MGDVEAVQLLLSQNVDINSKNQVNGWTALHWACKRNNEQVVKLLMNHGADFTIVNDDGRKAPEYLSHSSGNLSKMAYLFGGTTTTAEHNEGGGGESEHVNLTSAAKFTPNYLRNPPINGQVDVGARYRPRHTDISALPTTNLPASNDADLILKVRIHGSHDPDFIEIEIPRWKLTYTNLMHICCEELEVKVSQVERIRKLPNTRLRKDNDVKRLNDYSSLEILLKSPITDKHNSYPSISTKDQTILY